MFVHVRASMEKMKRRKKASNGICVFWMELAGFSSTVNSNRAVSW